jgi:hypothetical protein
MQIDISPTLIQAIEAVATAESTSANDWIVSQLENGVVRAQKLAALRRNFDEEQRKESEAKNDKTFEEIMKIHQTWTGL